MMIKSSLVCGLVTALFCAPMLCAQDPAPAPATPAAPAEAAPDLSDLDHAIDYGISVLEKKDYVTFFKTFADPAMIKAMTEKGGSVDDLAKAVSPKAAEGILFALKAAKNLKPKMEDDGNKATYTFPDEVVKEHNLRKSEMSFIRVDKRWYIKN